MVASGLGICQRNGVVILAWLIPIKDILPLINDFFKALF
jgi:hypothetical protein